MNGSDERLPVVMLGEILSAGLRVSERPATTKPLRKQPLM